MTRWLWSAKWIGLAAWVGGCAVTVGDEGLDVGDALGDDDDDDVPAGDDDDDDDSDPVGDDDDDGGNCDGTWDGVYDGAENGNFEARVVTSERRVYISDVSGNGLDGILDLSDDGALYGANQGFWMDGALDRSDCSMSGTWGVVELPGVDAGQWTTTP